MVVLITTFFRVLRFFLSREVAVNDDDDDDDDDDRTKQSRAEQERSDVRTAYGCA